MTRASLIIGDALPLLGASTDAPAVITSLPDMAETGQGPDEWRRWFVDAITMTTAAVTSNGPAIFYQTDRRHRGALMSKAAMVVEGAERAGARIMWHKVAVTTYGTRLHRPGFTHLIAVSRTGRPGAMTPDIITAGPKAYPNATDTASCAVAVDHLESMGITAVLDPFCGSGSILAHAAKRGMDTTGIDIDPLQIHAAAGLLAHAAGITPTITETQETR